MKQALPETVKSDGRGHHGGGNSPWMGRMFLLVVVCGILAFVAFDASMLADIMPCPAKGKSEGHGSTSSTSSSAAAALPAWAAGAPAAWRDYWQSLSALRVGAASPFADLEPQLRSWNYSLGPDELRRSLAYQGAAHRLRSLLEELRSGARPTLRVTVIGGSISWGSAVDRGSNDWFRWVGWGGG